MANSFLNKILEAGIYPVKYEITEPSLNEIFIGKVGAEE
jgi:ABC-2 type transport system ATP-binding protein